MTTTWKPLAPSASDDTSSPTFLISSIFTPQSYTVHLTDLTYIWSESLSREAVIERSQGTIIELEEGEDDNLHSFLQKIQGALEGQGGTTLDLTVEAVRRGPPALLLNVQAEVKGLGSLEWPIKLAAVSQYVLTTAMTVPLVRAVRLCRSEVTALLDALKEKDHVIQKLVDKIEAQGTDLGQVFPVAAGKGGRKVSKAWAEERVKGLGPFDPDSWGDMRVFKDTVNTKELLAEVFGSGVSSKRLEQATIQLGHQDKWWESKEHSSIPLTHDTSAKPVADHKIKTDRKSEKKHAAEEKDDFQVQATPPRKLSQEENNIGDSTEDDEDLDAPSQPVPDSFPLPPVSINKPRSNNLGGLRRQTNPQGKVPAQEDSDQDMDVKSKPSPPPKKAAPSRKKTASSILESSTETESEPEPTRRKGHAKKVSPKATKFNKKVQTKEDSETEEEARPSPPRKKSAPTKKSLAPILKSSTESESEPSWPPKQAPTKRSSPGLSSSRKKLRPKDDSMTENEEDLSLARPKTNRQGAKQGSIAAKRQKEDTETEDEDAASAVSLKGKAKEDSSAEEKGDSPPAPEGRKQKTKLGSITAKKQNGVSETEDEDASTPAPQKKQAKLGSLKKKVGASPPLSDSESEPEIALPTRTLAAAGKAKLGKLGGLRGKSPTASQEDKAEAPRKLGGLRGKTQTPEKDEEAPASRGRDKKKEATPPPPRETSIERADRKRAELKRALETKAKAPAKKKRKF